MCKNQGGKADGGGGPSGSINHHRGSIGGTTISLATRTEFAVLTLLSNLCIHGIGGLVTRRYLTEHSHHGVMDALQSMKVISDREERKQEIFAMLQGVVPHVEVSMNNITLLLVIFIIVYVFHP